MEGLIFRASNTVPKRFRTKLALKFQLTNIITLDLSKLDKKVDTAFI